MGKKVIHDDASTEGAAAQPDHCAIKLQAAITAAYLDINLPGAIETVVVARITNTRTKSGTPTGGCYRVNVITVQGDGLLARRMIAASHFICVTGDCRVVTSDPPLPNQVPDQLYA